MTSVKRLRLQFYYAAAVLFLAPFLLLCGEWTERSATTPSFLISGTVFLLLVLVGRWDITGYYLRPTLLLTFFIICFHKGGGRALVAAIGCLLSLWFLLSRPRAKPTAVIELSFPLRHGWYCVAHGGSIVVLNQHRRFPVKSQQYALDIVRLNALGFRSRGVYPSDPKAYAIFHDVVYSPCEGVITSIVNDQPDLSPGDMDPGHGAGNYIMIRCANTDTFVGLVHLAQSSIGVRPGDVVTIGQPLAQVGNSGYTSEPHLHIHAKRGSMLDGEGIAIRFDGEWLIRNSVVRTAARNQHAIIRRRSTLRAIFPERSVDWPGRS